MMRATTGWSSAPSGSSMMSRSEKRLIRNGLTSASVPGPPRLNSRMAMGAPVAVEVGTSDCPREDRRLIGARAQVTIEDHGDVPHQQPAGRRHLEGAALACDQA